LRIITPAGGDPSVLFDLQHGAVKSWLLLTAVELKVFDLCVEPVSSNGIAVSLGSHQENTELFLNALCALGLLMKKSGLYSNSELSRSFLVSGREGELGPYLMMSDQWNFQSRGQMKDSLFKGPMPAQSGADPSDEFFARNTRVMMNAGLSGGSQQTADLLSGLPGFDKMESMLDLGGAHGMDCMAVVQSHPSLKGTVFDREPVIAETRKIIREYGMEERMRGIGGDYVSDSLGGEYDLIHAKGTLNFVKGDLVPVLRKIRAALKEGGVFVSVHDGLSEERTAPGNMVISWLSSSLSSENFSFDQDLIPEALEEAGFRRIRTRTVCYPLFGNLDVSIAWK
jgi:predicted O-methyltransferase YrrM